jgi:hypothetical protein
MITDKQIQLLWNLDANFSREDNEALIEAMHAALQMRQMQKYQDWLTEHVDRLALHVKELSGDPMESMIAQAMHRAYLNSLASFYYYKEDPDLYGDDKGRERDHHPLR